MKNTHIIRLRAFSIRLGATAPPLHEQLSKQGIRIKPTQAALVEKVCHLQRDMDALVRLTVRGLLTDSERSKLGRRLVKRIFEAVQ